MALVKTLIGNCKGPKGDPGEQGVPGAQGIQGADGVRGSRIVSGTTITGTSTTAKTYATGIADSLVNDHYINTTNGNIYRCTKAGDANTAQWVFVGNVTSNNTFTIELGYIWEEIDSGLSDIRSIASDGGNLLVAVGHNLDDVDSGNIAFSDNGGITWRIAPIVPVKTALNSVTYSPHGYFVAVGENGTILKSVSGNGGNWELVAEGPVEGKQEAYNMYPDSLRCVVWNDINQMFVAVGGEARGNYDTDYKHLILTSSDGQNWQRQYLNVGSYFTDKYILTSIACDSVGGGTFAAGGNGIIVTSVDGQSWDVCPGSTDYGADVRSIKLANNRYICVNSGGYSVQSGNGPNIDDWSYDISMSSRAYDIEFIDDLNIFVLVGGDSNDSDIKYSSNGYHVWSESWTGLSDNDQSSEFRGTLFYVKHVPNTGTFIGRDDGKILKLTNTDITKNTTEAVEEMYTKLILQKS